MPEPVDAAMVALLARRAGDIAAGARPVGWKIGLNAPALQVHFGLSGPVVGYLTDATVIEPATDVPIADWTRPALEVEVAIRVSEDGLGVAGLAPALELVDLDPAFDDLEAILRSNVFHRGVVFGPEVPGVDVSHLEVQVRRNGETVAAGRLMEAPSITVDVVRTFLETHGAALAAGDRIIAGSMIAPMAVAPGDALDIGFGALGQLGVRFV